MVPDSEILRLSACELAAAIRDRSLSPVEILDAVLDAAHRLNPDLNAFCLLPDEDARAAARAAEAAIQRGETLGPLHGVPISVKDNTNTAGWRTARGSAMYLDFVPNADAPIVERIRAAGGIVFGKTTTPELGWKGVTDSPAFGVTRNPWDLTKTPGGSSGGAAAAVAARIGPIGTGTDGAGSLRIPASFCGIFTLKPSLGRIPFYPPSGAPTLAHLGCLSVTVADTAAFLDATVGPDPRDPVSLPAEPGSYLDAIEGDLTGLRIAWSSDLGYASVDPEVRELCTAAATRFTGLGATVDEASPGLEDPYWIIHALFYTTTAAMLEPALPKWRDRLDPGLVRVIDAIAGREPLYMARASLKRSELWDRMQAFFQRYDLLLTPTMPTAAFDIELQRPPGWDDDPNTALNWTPLTYPFNLTGQPAASVPCGWTAAGLPVGLQIVGNHLEDRLVLRAAAAFERLAPWRDRLPPLVSVTGPHSAR